MLNLIANILNGLIILSLIITPNFTLANLEIKYITPPKLEYENVGKKITCYRPLRHGFSKMNIEKNMVK